jgi:hypothetical protein
MTHLIGMKPRVGKVYVKLIVFCDVTAETVRWYHVAEYDPENTYDSPRSSWIGQERSCYSSLHCAV